MLQLKAKPGCCEEAAMGIPFYAPCNKPAVNMVGWKKRSDKPIRMCAMCTDHNVRNRGGEVVGPFVEPKFRWILSYMGTVEYEVTDVTGTYRAEIRHSFSDYELSIANGDDVRRQIKESVGIVHRHSCASPTDSSFEMPAETVAAFNAWRLAEHNAHIAKLEAAPERYGVIADDDPLRKPPMIAKRGRFERGHWRVTEPEAAAA